MPEERRREAILFGLALVLRLAWAADMSRLPFFDLPTGDSLFYAQRASRIAGGEFIGAELAYPSSPLFPYLIAPFFLLAGRGTFWALYAAQAVLDALNAVILRRAGTALFGRAAGWIAGIAWGGYGLAVFFTADVVEATAAAFCADLFLLLLATSNGARKEAAGPRPLRPGRAALAGAAMGGACLLRPHFLALLPVAACGALRLAPPGRRLRALAAFTIAGSSILAISLARNAAAAGEAVLVSPYSGLNAYLGNRRGARGDLSFPAGRGLRNDMDLKDAAHTYPEAVEGRPLTRSEVSRFWWRETRREVSADPGAWAALMARKARLFWSSSEPPNHLDFDFFRAGSIPLSLAAVPYGLISPLALVGAALAVWAWWAAARGSRPGEIAGGPGDARAAVMLVGLTAAYGAACTTFFVADRFRLPATGWLCVLAGGAIAWILRAAAARRYAASAAAAAAAIALGVFLHNPQPPRHGVRERVMAAAILAGRGRVAEAESLVRNAVSISPESALARFNLGRLLAGTGRPEEAGAEFAEAVRLAPDMAAAHAALGDLARAKRTPAGDAEARRRYDAALAIEPYGPDADRIRRWIVPLGGAAASGR